MEITPPAEYGDPPATPLSDVPLAVDLDGTLVRTDLLVESFFVLIRRNPLYAVAALFWLLRGRAYLKRQIGRRVTLDAAALPYHYELLDFLKDQRMQGRRLILASGCDEAVGPAGGRLSPDIRRGARDRRGGQSDGASKTGPPRRRVW